MAHADPLYRTRSSPPSASSGACVESGGEPGLFGIEPPKLRIEVVRIVDMSTSNAWAVFAGI